ncbi:GNAT family N-acetyltransferase [Urechidicola vernalis]|uniref:GNAT family N-acetyltransferase n=1 Tax=Urechidicola vernalis TaxID=3075600 RepID=A0ABU2Y253_9FLAO|nr:GNAT family N-acetyltransferase [Urechidicola sp. P050]MDT0552241.1 GNAT family N-acetyltransferase [Urechidicola sp. P050]
MEIIKEIKAEDTWELRHKVMWPNKSIDFVKILTDDKGTHFGLFLNKELVTIVSLFIDGKKAQFRKLATLPSEQGKGYASLILRHIFEQAKSKGVHKIWCNARKDKLEFYLKKGFTKTSESFEKSGIAYNIIEKALN